MFSLSLKVGNEVYESSGETMADCLRSLPQPRKLTQKGIITLRNGDKTREEMWMPFKLKKLWLKDSPMYLGKQFELLVA